MNRKKIMSPTPNARSLQALFSMAGLNLLRRQWLLREKLRFTVARLSEQPSSMEANYRSWCRSWCFFQTAHCTATVTEHPKVNTYRGLEQEVEYEQEPIGLPLTKTMSVNYAHAIGFDSVAAAAIFAVLYVPLLGWFILQSFKHPTYVHIVLSLFCASKSFFNTWPT
jgi:hypothetical protein